MLNRWFLILVLFCFIPLVSFTQISFGTGIGIGSNVGIGGGTSSGHSVTANLGMTVASDLDGGNAGFPIAVPFTTPTPSSGSVSLNSTFHVYIGAAASGTNGMAIYTDNGGTVVGGTLVCGVMVSSNSPTNNADNTYTATGCPSTLSAGTQYWVAFSTSDSTLTQGSNAQGNCSDGGMGLQVNSTMTTWLTTWPASSANSQCHSAYVQVTYTSTNKYDFITFGGTNETVGSVNSFNVQVPAFGSGHSLIIATISGASGGGGTVTATDSAGDTITANGSCVNAGGGGNSGTCILSAARATAGVHTVTPNYSVATGHSTTIILEVAGTLSSSSYDVSEYDSALQGTPFTSGNATTAGSNELLIGLSPNINNCSLPCGTFSGGTNWNISYQGSDDHSAPNKHQNGFFYSTTNTAGSNHLSGSFSAAGTSNMPGFVAFK